MYLAVGSYERFLFGYGTQLPSTEVRVLHPSRPRQDLLHPLRGNYLPLSQEEVQKLPRKFTLAAHKVCFQSQRIFACISLLIAVLTYYAASLQNTVKCIDACGKYLVSGGADDTIHLYDVKVGSPVRPECSSSPMPHTGIRSYTSIIAG
jgi:hypothetical protein